ncbi:3-deoxy-manno-octulosonate cytidylyltransferase [Sphingobacterium sp. UT-1RO-CII-1]|uniref:3-deoxy-manno-octulosonate cytidylyltransferase n=1 Tax=Sphingobacterium sp. UT-1RO-CII-1 TaxID=2995225 RepID=UPI00227CBA64|nr:3-deoxy-manno-octulosonate cytidylyltransferase [Sphingobacterium sp. UT-1RO-CII-1]MCY4781471.1 3-deoxy-manno-octulosonate cytidylyltransferase [Sphingobacterium sp. UT-1RO-CII-1]
MKIIGIIPARYDSTRFPGKPLIDIDGMTMIERVYKQVKKCESLHEIIVATDDQRIAEHVNKFGGKVIMTSKAHQSGTDRCAEVISKITGYDVAINIQGDEPYINPNQIDQLAALFQDSTIDIGTLVKRINQESELFNENIPKVVFNVNSIALYFSRHPIPFQRGIEQNKWLKNHTYFKHIGIYGYRIKTLNEITNLPVSSFEQSEGLEQLRWLQNGYTIKLAETNLETIAVDRPEDLEAIKKVYFNK